MRTKFSFFLISCIAWSAFVCFTGKDPKAILSKSALMHDHVAHYNATALFLMVGQKIYTRTIQESCEKDSSQSEGAWRLAKEWNVTPKWFCVPKTPKWKGPPLYINWQSAPRLYPPGHLMFFLPEALALRAGINFRWINKVAVVKCVIMAHVALFIVTLLLSDLRPRILAWLFIWLSYVGMVHWALLGFYDPLAISFALLSVLQLKKSRQAYAFAWYGAAVFTHFRALWCLPIGLYSLGIAIRQWWSGELKRSEKLALAGGIVLASIAGLIFLQILPYPSQLPANNLVYYKNVLVSGLAAVGWQAVELGLATVLAVKILASQRAWLAVACVATCTLFIIVTPELQAWHQLFWLPTLCLVSLATERNHARLLQCLGLGVWYILLVDELFDFGFIGSWTDVVCWRLFGWRITG